MLSYPARAAAQGGGVASFGIRSTLRCNSWSLAAVAGPTAAMRTPPMSRMSSKALKKYSKNAVTPLGLVKINQS